MASFFITCYYIHICLYMHIFLKISCVLLILLLLCMFSELTCKQLVFSLGKTFSSTSSSHQSPVILCVVWRSRGLFPVHCPMSFAVILAQITFRQSCWGDFMFAVSEIIRRHNRTANSLIFWLLGSFCPLFLIAP